MLQAERLVGYRKVAPDGGFVFNIKTMHCLNCEKQLNETDKFCVNCGSPIKKSEEVKHEKPLAQETPQKLAEIEHDGKVSKAGVVAFGSLVIIQTILHYVGWAGIIFSIITFIFGNSDRGKELLIGGLSLLASKYILGFIFLRFAESFKKNKNFFIGLLILGSLLGLWIFGSINTPSSQPVNVAPTPQPTSTRFVPTRAKVVSTPTPAQDSALKIEQCKAQAPLFAKDINKNCVLDFVASPAVSNDCGGSVADAPNTAERIRRQECYQWWFDQATKTCQIKEDNLADQYYADCLTW